MALLSRESRIFDHLQVHTFPPWLGIFTASSLKQRTLAPVAGKKRGRCDPHLYPELRREQ